MISFLFWNLGKRPLLNRVVRMAVSFDVDVLMLAECMIDPDELLGTLNGLRRTPFSFPFSEGNKVSIFVRYPESSLLDEFNDPLGGLTIRQLNVGGLPGMLLAVAHLPSRMNWRPEGQTLAATTLPTDIQRTEDRLGHRRTILIGDLNMNPFDPGVAGSHALNAVMTRELARRGERIVSGRASSFFYNPMWGHFGDRTEGPPGSYFLSSSDPGNLFWNIYDQVLLRPSLMDNLESVRILETDGHPSLLLATRTTRRARVPTISRFFSEFLISTSRSMASIPISGRTISRLTLSRLWRFSAAKRVQ